MDERIKFIKRARGGQLGKTLEENRYWERVADEMEALDDFSTFRTKYAADISEDEVISLGAGNIVYVGHVGIIDVDETTGQQYVIEALWREGAVVRTPYDQ